MESGCHTKTGPASEVEQLSHQTWLERKVLPTSLHSSQHRLCLCVKKSGGTALDSRLTHTIQADGFREPSCFWNTRLSQNFLMYDDTKLPINCLLYIPEETKENHSQVIANTDPLKTASSSLIVLGHHFTTQRKSTGAVIFSYFILCAQKRIYSFCTCISVHVQYVQKENIYSFYTFILPSSPQNFECYTNISWFLRCMKIATLAQGNPRCLYKL